jgi:hypothetical protein
VATCLRPHRLDPGEALRNLDTREVEYAEAQIFRSSLIAPMVGLVAVAGAIVAILHLSWKPLVAVLSLAAAFMLLAVRVELQAHRRWQEALNAARAATGLPPETGSSRPGRGRPSGRPGPA